MSENQDKKIEDPIQKPSTSKDESQQQRGKRGSGSKKSHDRSFFTKKNTQYENDRRSKLRGQFLGEDFEEITKLVEMNIESGITHTTPIPMTTRGIGFHTAMLWNYARGIIPNIYPIPSVHRLYRVSLIQLNLQLNRLDAQRNYDFNIEPLPRVMKALKSVENRNSRFNTNLINAFGKFSYSGHYYDAIVPYPRKGARIKTVAKTIEVEEPSYIALSPPSDDRPTPSKRKITEVIPSGESIIDIPDPYHITINNLRSTCELMMNLQVPLDYRRFFIRMNPIPNAVYVNDLLTNIDEIMPNNYFANDNVLSQDMQEYSQFMALCESHCNKVIGTCAFDGKGSSLSFSSQDLRPHLANSTKEFRLDGTHVVTTGEQLIFREHVPVQQLERMIGAVLLAGELPWLPGELSLPSAWSYRSPNTSHHSFSNSWPSLVSNLYRG